MSQTINLNIKQIFDLAFENQNKKNYQAAIMLYEKINETDPKIKNVQFNLGTIYEELNDGVKLVDMTTKEAIFQTEEKYLIMDFKNQIKERSEY